MHTQWIESRLPSEKMILAVSCQSVGLAGSRSRERSLDGWYMSSHYSDRQCMFTFGDASSVVDASAAAVVWLFFLFLVVSVRFDFGTGNKNASKWTLQVAAILVSDFFSLLCIFNLPRCLFLYLPVSFTRSVAHFRCLFNHLFALPLPFALASTTQCKHLDWFTHKHLSRSVCFFVFV